MDLEKPKVDDHEAKMARAELYKLNQYSAKLFKLIGENDELDGWVQAKITKAADYISSVYHYMEYEQMAAAKVEKGPRDFEENVHESVHRELSEKWSEKYKRSINCNSPKGFSQRAHCAGRKK
jgi:hypothetical protein